MKEQRGPFGRIAESVSGSLRRRQDREPRAIVFDPEGHPRVVPAGTPEHAALIETAERMVELTGRGRGRDDGGDETPSGGDATPTEGDEAPSDGDAGA